MQLQSHLLQQHDLVLCVTQLLAEVLQLTLLLLPLSCLLLQHLIQTCRHLAAVRQWQGSFGVEQQGVEAVAGVFQGCLEEKVLP